MSAFLHNISEIGASCKNIKAVQKEEVDNYSPNNVRVNGSSISFLRDKIQNRSQDVDPQGVNPRRQTPDDWAARSKIAGVSTFTDLKSLDKQ